MRGISGFILGLFCSFLHAQDVPNNSFEIGSGVSVSSWITNENIYGISDTVWTMRDTVSRTNGLYAVELTSDTFLATSNESAVIAASLMLGNFHHATGSTSATISPIYYNSKPDTLYFDYQYAPNGNDSAGFQFIFYNANTALLNLSGTLGAQSVWKTDTVILTSLYNSDIQPDSLFVQFRSSANSSTAQLGSKLSLDNIRLRIDSSALVSAIPTVSDDNFLVYPNPVSGILFVDLAANTANATLEIFDLQGRLLLTEKANSGKNILQTGSFKSGNYVLSVRFSDSAAVGKKRVLVTVN